MKKIAIIAVFVFALIAAHNAEAAEYTKVWGCTNSDSATSIKPTADGNTILIGNTRKNYDKTLDDIYLAKIDPLGTIIWETTFGTSNYDSSYDVEETADGNFVALGYTTSGVYKYMLLAKFDKNGNQLWSQIIGNGYSYGYGMDICRNGDIVVTGGSMNASKYYDVLLTRVDTNGYVVWNKVFSGTGGNGDDYGRCVKETANGDILVGGAFYSTNTFALIMRTDAKGNTIWQKTYQNGYIESIYENSSGTIIACGSTTSIGAGGWDAYLLKIDSVGTKAWEKTFGKTAADYGHKAIPTFDGGIALLMETGAGSTPAGTCVFLARLDGTGTQKWGRIIGLGGDSSVGYSMFETSDGGFAIAGYTNAFYKTKNTEFFLTKIDDPSS